MRNAGVTNTSERSGSRDRVGVAGSCRIRGRAGKSVERRRCRRMGDASEWSVVVPWVDGWTGGRRRHSKHSRPKPRARRRCTRPQERAHASGGWSALAAASMGQGSTQRGALISAPGTTDGDGRHASAVLLFDWVLYCPCPRGIPSTQTSTQHLLSAPLLSSTRERVAEDWTRHPPGSGDSSQGALDAEVPSRVELKLSLRCKARNSIRARKNAHLPSRVSSKRKTSNIDCRHLILLPRYRVQYLDVAGPDLILLGCAAPQIWTGEGRTTAASHPPMPPRLMRCNTCLIHRRTAHIIFRDSFFCPVICLSAEMETRCVC